VRRRRAMAETEMIDRYIANMCEIDALLDDMYEIYDCCEMLLDWGCIVERRSANFSLHPIFGSTT
jgi:hypothetical protein